MKKYFWMLGSLVMGLAMFTSCSSDDEEDVRTEMEKNYFKVENAVYTEGTMPVATSNEALNVNVDAITQKGGTNIVKIARDREYRHFFIGVKGVPGYWIYTPTSTLTVKAVSRGDDEDWDEFYEIDLDNSDGNVNNYTLLVSGEDMDGNVTKPFEQEINLEDKVKTGLCTRITYNGKVIYTMDYDNQGRLTYFASGDYAVQINYSKKTIKEDDEGDIFTYKYSLDSKGRITSMSSEDGTYRLQYDSDGHLAKFVAGGSVSYNWFAGNLTSTYVDFVGYDGDKFSYTAEYGNHINVAGQVTVVLNDLYVSPLIASLVSTGLLGTECKNLPDTITEEEETFPCSYTFNSDGTIDKEIMNYGYYTVTFQHHYDSASKASSQTPSFKAMTKDIDFPLFHRRTLHQMLKAGI